MFGSLGLSPYSHLVARNPWSRSFLEPAYSFCSRLARLTKNSASEVTSPGGLTAFSCHWISRMVLVSDPSFSAAGAAGRKNTSVLISFAVIPGAFQNSAVSVRKMSFTTSHSSLPSAARASLALGPPTAGFCPSDRKPLMMPLYMSTNMCWWL